jgi:centrosomal protein CEP135
MDSVEGLKASAADEAARAGGDAAAGSDAEAKLAALEKENEDLRSTLTGTEEACEGMQRELERIQTEYNALASTLSGTLDTSNEEEEEF